MRNKFWFAVETADWQMKVALVTFNDNKMYWYGGPAYVTITEKPSILKEYNSADFSDEEGFRYDDLEVQFHKDFPPLPSGVVRSAGWLSPGGEFYATPAYVHRMCARRLSAIYYNSLDGQHLLEKKGWVNVAFNGGVWYPLREITEQQAQVVLELATQGDEMWQDNLYDFLDRMSYETYRRET